MKSVTATSPQPQAGFSVVELMISITLGLFIILIIAQAYLSSIQAQNSQTNLARLNENARFAFDILSKSVYRAGFRNTVTVLPATYNGTSRPEEFCSSTGNRQLFGINNPGSIDPTSSSLSGSTATIVNNGDALRVSYYGEDNSNGTSADTSTRDCKGYPVRRGQLISDTLFIAADSSNGNAPTLFCHNQNPDGNSQSVPLVPDIEAMQFLYGEDTDNDGTINRYVTASTVSNWDQVRSVKVGLVVRSSSESASSASSKTFNLFGTGYAAGNAAPSGDSASVFTNTSDRRLRHNYTSEFSVRNRPLC